LKARLDFVLHWLEARQPDVVGLQELKMDEDRFPRLEFEAAGYQAILHGQKAWNGVAVLARSPLEPVQVGLPGQEEMGARLLTVRGAGLHFTTVYVPNGKSVDHEDYPRKLAWLDSLVHYYQENQSAAEAHVLCGDFNVCPAGIDSWNEADFHGHVHHTDAERDRLAALTRWGLVDLFRAKYPDRQQFSWWDYRAGSFHRNRGLRIDLLYGTTPVAARVVDVVVDRDYRKKKDGMIASDHAPVILELTD
ncbi:MAG: exodeoxyribonuclease III, partial [Gemmatimonadetes bacterium]|nr:exodeoxyribonuclease III [Gemmatimonadota bacterium]